ncbi:adhesion G-protein coupled receptor G6 isoform X2 [Oryzias latipes]
MSPSALSYRKNKPVGRHWSLLSTSDWTHAPDDPPTSDIFMYDLVEASGSSNVHDAPPSLEGSAQTPPEPSDSSLPEKTFQKDSEDDPEDTGGLQPKISPPPPPSSAAFAPPKLMIVAEIFQQDPIPASVASYCSYSSASQPLLFPLKSAPSSQTPPSILPSPPPRLTFISSFSQMEQSFPENSPPPLLAPSRHQFEALAVPAGRSPPSFSDSFDGGLPPSEGQSPIGASHALSADGGRTFDSGGFLFLSAALPVAFPSDLRDSMETPPLPHPSGLDRSSSDFSTTAAPLHEEKSVSWTSSPSTWRPGPRGGLSLAVHADAPPLHPGAEESLSAVQTLWAGSRPSDQKLHLQNQRIPDSAHAAAGTASAPDRHTSRVLQFSAFPLPTLQASQSPRHPIPTPQLEVTHQNNRHSPEQTLGFDAREESNPNVQHAEVWPSLSLSDSLTPLSSSSSVHINLSLSPPLHPSSLIISSFTPLPPSSSLPPVLREQTAQQPPHRKNAPSQRPGHKKEFSVPLPSPAAPPQPLHSAQTQNERPATPPRLVSWFGPAEISPKIHPAGEMDSGEFSSPPRSTAPSTPTAAPVLPTPPHAFDLNTPSSTPPFGSSISALNQSFAPGHEYLQRPGSETGLKGSSHSNKTAVVSLKEGRLEALTTPPSTVPAQSKSKSSEDPNPGASGILDPEHGNPSPTPHVVLHAHEPMKDAPALGLSNAVSVSAHGGGGDATDLAAALSGPCQCKRRFDLSCLCGVSSGNKDLFYRVSFWTTSELSQQAVERAVSLLLNQAFHKWTHSVEHFSVVKTGAGSNRFSCQALLLISNESLSADDVSAQLTGRRLLEDSQLQLFSVSVRLIENCQEDVFLNYYWPETRPRTTQLLPCFPDKNQSATRTCLINLNDYSPYWASADFTNCTVTAENAADVAEKLANFTRNGLSDDEISHVVTKVQQLVNVAKIDAAVAESVVSIISNVMTSSEAVLGNASNIALRTVDELAQKLEFDGLSVNITSKHLALGILAFNATTFNGSSFSAFIPPNSADPKIEFEQTANPLAQVTLPGSLLSGVSLSDADRSSLSRINFVFFSNTNLFKKEQDSLSLNSYVVASSVGNLSIRDLKDPVRIQIAHLTEQTSSHRFCMFWDFTLNNGDGGWNERGCSVSKESTRNKTICLCNHLTHFGVLMDVSQTSSQIDPKNKKILTFLSYIGCGVSAICAAATLLTYIAFEKLRRDYPSKILMNLSTSLLCLNMVFLLDGWLASMVDSAGLCTSAAVLLHYFLLTSFTWMGLESIHMYIALVKVFNTYIRRYILKFCAVGWGLPAVIVGIVVTVDKSHYGILEDSKDESAKMCWIKNQSVFYTTCVGYFCLVFLLNVAMFIVVMMQICGRNGKRSNRSLREEVLRNLRSVVSLTFLLGMTWGFALFAWGPVYLAFTYLFTIFNSLQGVFIFIFHCALKENVQKQWRRYLCCGPYRQSDNSDLSKTPTNNTKKVSSDNLAKSLSSSSFGSSTSNWTSKAKATLTPFSKRYRNAESSSHH